MNNLEEIQKKEEVEEKKEKETPIEIAKRCSIV